MNFNLNGAIDFLKSQINDCNRREDLWKIEKLDYQRQLQTMKQELDEQKTINRQLIERLNSIKFAFQPLTENIKKNQVKTTKVGHHRVKSDMDHKLPGQFNQSQPLINTQSSNEKRKEKKPLLINFLNQLEAEEDYVQSTMPFSSPQSASLNIQIQPSQSKIPQILINQTNYNTISSGNFQKTQHQSPMIQTQQQKKVIYHHHQRSNSNNVEGAFQNIRTQKEIKNNINLDLSSQNDFSLQSVKRISITEREIIVGKQMFEVVTQLRSHLDGVRSMIFSDNTLATASEDCTIKLWDVKMFQNMTEQLHLEPIHTIRQHLGPIFALTSNQTHATKKNQQLLLYSAGTDGSIHAYISQNRGSRDLSHEKDFTCYWNAHSDAIWQLKHHPVEQRILSISADSSVKLWKSLDSQSLNDMYQKGMVDTELIQNPLANFTFRKSMNGLSIPTSVDWITQFEKIVCGYNDSQNFVVFDLATVKICNQFKFFNDQNAYKQYQMQPNKILFQNELNYIVSGHEDQQIRFLDYQSGKVIKSLVGHTDSVTDLTFFPQNAQLLSSVSHDGSMRTWDIRKFQCVHEIPAHKKKYDESIHAITANRQYVVTGGADGMIKLFKQDTQGCI